ncbi:MAG: NUDIX hydrolase [Chloroflexota bacterium]
MTVASASAYCPSCGDSLIKRFVEEEERDRLVCAGCGRIHYLNPVVVAGAVPAAGKRIWLLRRGIKPRYGYWTFPAGFMEMGETVQEAARRETREELSLEIELGELIGVYSRPRMSNVHIVFEAVALGDPSAGRETLDFAPFTPDEIPWDDLAFHTTYDALRDWVRRRS